MNLTPDQFVDPVPGLLVCRLAWFTLHDDFVTLEVSKCGAQWFLVAVGAFIRLHVH